MVVSSFLRDVVLRVVVGATLVVSAACGAAVDKPAAGSTAATSGPRAPAATGAATASATSGAATGPATSGAAPTGAAVPLEPLTVKFGHVAATPYAPAYVAADKGYFQERG